MSDSNVQQALRDISAIRRVMRNVAFTKKPRLGLSAIDAAITLHIVALVFAVVFLVLESGLPPFSDPTLSTTLFLKLSAHDATLKKFIITVAGIFLLGLSAGMYTVLWSAARKDGEELSDYLLRNFAPFTALSFFSDLSIKFCAIAMAVAAGRPEWVSPLLLLCSLDYLIQGRFFSLPVKLSVVAGILASVAGATQFFAGSGALSVALSVFVVIASASTACLFRTKKAAAKDTDASPELEKAE
jgi:hypothetical protein